MRFNEVMRRLRRMRFLVESAARQHADWLFRPAAAFVIVGLGFLGVLGTALVTVGVERVFGPAPVPQQEASVTEVASPVTAAAPTMLGAHLQLDVLRLHPDARYYDAPTRRGAVNVGQLRREYDHADIGEALDVDRCFAANDRIYGYFLASLMMRREGRNGRDRAAAQEMARAVIADVESGETTPARVRAARAYARMLDGEFYAEDDNSAHILEIARLALELLTAHDARYFPPPGETDVPLPVDAGAIFDVVLRNTGDETAYITRVRFETISVGLDGTGQGGGETMNAYPVETTATLTLATNDDEPVDFRDPIRVPPDHTARFVINVDPYLDDERAGLYYVHAWVGRIHFASADGDLVVTEPICTFLPFQPSESFW